MVPAAVLCNVLEVVGKDRTPELELRAFGTYLNQLAMENLYILREKISL